MEVLGNCVICGRPARATCAMCGMPVCPRHYDPETGLCDICRERIKRGRGTEGPSGKKLC
jgi:hypothetical protein